MSDKEGEWYPDHILSWYPYRDQENVLFVMYEDLKKVIFADLIATAYCFMECRFCLLLQFN